MKSTSTDETEPPERSAGFVLYNVDKQGKRCYLLLRHYEGGHWGVPKGRIEPGEKELDAALRETKEETGIKKIKPIPSFRAVSRYRFARNGVPVCKEVIYFLGRVDAGVVLLSEEHAEWRWLAYPDAWDTLTYVETRAVLCAADHFLQPKPMKSHALTRRSSQVESLALSTGRGKKDREALRS